MKINISKQLVEKLIFAQFPKWAKLLIKEVMPNGWDNRTYRLGNEMSIRLPSAKRYAEKVKIEQKWLPKLAPYLSVPIPKPIAIGEPTEEYPWNWSIYSWIEGQSANTLTIDDQNLEKIALQLANFLKELQSIDMKDALAPGYHNFFRGSSPAVYESEVYSSIDVLQDYIDTSLVNAVWEKAISSKWDKKPVWVHGDFSSSNILIKNNNLCGVIDWGGMAVGDPSCDLVIAWTFLRNKSREIFKSSLDFDKDTWNRSRGWALWKALITLESIKDKSNVEAKYQLKLLNEILN